jgi:hypothetical protein
LRSRRRSAHAKSAKTLLPRLSRYTTGYQRCEPSLRTWCSHIGGLFGWWTLLSSAPPSFFFTELGLLDSETDLWNYSLSLREIDKMRVDGKFVDAEGNRPTGQYVSLINERRSFWNSDRINNSGLVVPLASMLWTHLPATIV